MDISLDYNEIIDLLMPLMPDESVRRSLVILALGPNSPVLRQLNFAGPVEPFILHLVQVLEGYGEVQPGKKALWAVLETARERVGVDRQARIDTLRAVINGPGGSTDPPSISGSPVADPGPVKVEFCPPRQIDFVIVTPLAEERDAVLAWLPGYRKLPPAEDDIRVYYAADIPVRFPDGTEACYAITVVPLARMGHTEAASAAGDAVRRWQPRYVVLVGIAGGLAQAGVQLGDVLISDQVADYELQKITAGQPVYRWQVHQADQRLLIAAQNFTARDWEHTAARRPNRRRPQVHFGPLCTGNKVIADESLTNQFREVWAKLIGVEMEAGGVANAVAQAARAPGFFMIRGVSDLADGRKDSRRVKSWRPYACEIAAAYAIEFLKSGPVPVAEKGAAGEPKTESGARAGKPAASLALPGPVRVQWCQRLGDSWRNLAEYLEIPPHDQARFERGDEGRAILVWLENRRQLARLREALESIRPDLISLLNAE